MCIYTGSSRVKVLFSVRGQFHKVGNHEVSGACLIYLYENVHLEQIFWGTWVVSM